MTVLRYPGARWRPLGEQTQPAMSGHHLLVVHTMVGNLRGTDAYFCRRGYGGTESHYGIGGRWGSDHHNGLDGVVYQWQERDRTADANLEANPWAISIETADNYPERAEDIDQWSDAQARALVQLLAWECSPAAHAGCPPTWACHRQGIPAALVPDSRPGRRGIAYHRQGIDPWRVEGGQRWSTARGKECPGPVRIRQLEREVAPAVAALLADVPDAPVPPPRPPAPRPDHTEVPVQLPIVRPGDSGEDVQTVQALLHARGRNPGPMDGRYGPRTTDQVKAIQRAANLAADGIVGPRTWPALLSVS